MNKKVKTVEQQVKEVVEPAKVKRQRFEVHFRKPEEFKIFENVMGYQIGANWLQIVTEDDAAHIYPASDIKQIIVTQVE